MFVVARALDVANIPYLIYANDIIIFHADKDINHCSNLLNQSLSIRDTEHN